MAFVRAALCFALGVVFAIEGVVDGESIYFGVSALAFFLSATNADLEQQR